MSEYYLMNKDRRLLLFSVYYNDYDQCKVKEIERYVDEALMPPGFRDLFTWLDNRNYAKYKFHLSRRMKEWKLDNIKDFIDTTRGLSLNDSLWIKPADSDQTWSQINLYDNEFYDVVSEIVFDRAGHGAATGGADHGAVTATAESGTSPKSTLISPEFTAEGSYKKCWIREDDGIWIYKRGSKSFSENEVYSEYYASQYSKAICRSYVDYDLVKINECLVSRCRMFTNENEGFIPMYKYLDGSIHYFIDDLMGFLEPYGAVDDFRRMLILDAVIMNPDRHMGNFGFIVDNDTFEVLRFAPVFDHNMSLLAKASEEDIKEPDSAYIKNLRHKMDADFVTVAKKLCDDQMRQTLQELLDEPLKLHPQYNLDKSRTDFIERQVHKQIESILE